MDSIKKPSYAFQILVTTSLILKSNFFVIFKIPCRFTAQARAQTSYRIEEVASNSPATQRNSTYGLCVWNTENILEAGCETDAEHGGKSKYYVTQGSSGSQSFHWRGSGRFHISSIQTLRSGWLRISSYKLVAFEAMLFFSVGFK